MKLCVQPDKRARWSLEGHATKKKKRANLAFLLFNLFKSGYYGAKKDRRKCEYAEHEAAPEARHKYDNHKFLGFDHP